MKVVLDACVLYPACLRDFLLHLAHTKLYIPMWSEKINEEWSYNLIKNQKGLKIKNLERTIKMMNLVFPSSNVTQYEYLETNIELPDIGDRHVLAVAIKSNSELIITNNLKDFPEKELNKYGIGCMSPDEFISYLLWESNKILVLRAFENHKSKLTNPPINKEQLLSNFKRVGLIETSLVIENSDD